MINYKILFWVELKGPDTVPFSMAKFQKIAAALSACVLTVAIQGGSAVAAPLLNKNCSKLKASTVSDGIKLTCVLKSGKKVWVQTSSSKTTQNPTETVAQINAIAKAKSYLRSSSFSRKGLIEQMEFSGFSIDDATYGVDKLKTDWNAQAILKAKSYLRSSSFSRKSLIEQMEFTGFSSNEALYGVDTLNTDWNAQAVLKAKSYLRSSSFSRKALIEQMEFTGFTPEQAIFGVDATGL